MTDGFAAAVTVSIPIFALAAGAEARSIRDRLAKPDPSWEREFAQPSAEPELGVSGSAAQVFAYFKNVPKLSRRHALERAIDRAADTAEPEAEAAAGRQERPGEPAGPEVGETA